MVEGSRTFKAEDSTRGACERTTEWKRNDEKLSKYPV